MADNYEQLIKTPSWEKLKEAQRAIFALEMSLEQSGFPELRPQAFMARIKLTEVENNLRFRFKHLDAHLTS